MKKPLIILIVLHTLIPFAFAQQQTGNNPSPATHPKDTVGIGFDATRQMFQRRYQHPDAVPFDTLWKNNVYISLFGGMDKMIPRGNTDFNTGPVGGIAANWQFAPAHALRASLLAGNFAQNRQRNPIAFRTAGGLSAECIILRQRLQSRTYLRVPDRSGSRLSIIFTGRQSGTCGRPAFRFPTETAPYRTCGLLSGTPLHHYE